MKRIITTSLPVVPLGRTMMFAVLVDDQNNQQMVELGLEETFKVDAYFSPCGVCGSAILQSAWYGVTDGDCCARCGIAYPDNESITLDEAKDFLASCVNYLRGGFHPDTLGESYVSNTGKTFTDEEAIQYDKNMTAAFRLFKAADLDVYAWSMNYAATTFPELAWLYEA